MEVSAEGYLAVNFLFDFFLLCLPARGTWFFAAAFAAVVPMCLIAYPLADGRRFLAASARVLLYAFVLAGAMEAARRVGAGQAAQMLAGMAAVWAVDALGRQLRPERDTVQLRVWSGRRLSTQETCFGSR